ncbi:alpha-amlyase [Actinoplanes sp. SE50]|uniref:alpha-amylase family glycosyl hydrolase n=1 Tax=unclassified Actinoplanes TaxID=2626549 RepID=UPI00023EC0D9|nr:acarbose resistent alpha-amylase [Actinoplanes sp. SE50/110]ATO82970.1 alpha-amlyase [Actinoplanes sp. SE50]SLM00378.1 acarbose-resistant alpha-amylase, pullulanase [Actinoplanes sp. SE50/110]
MDERLKSHIVRALLPVLVGAAGGLPAPRAAQAESPPDRPSHAEQLYLVMPDRFANGDTGNDQGGLTGDRLTTGYDPTDAGFYHGGDIQGVIDKLDYIQGLGTTAIWLTPIFKNKPVQGTGPNASAGYHGYWITDFTQVDPHFGTNEDLKRLVGLAHRRGMKIYLDIVVNHTADVIKNAEGTAYADKGTAPYRDTAGRPFEDRNYADGTHGFPKVDEKSFPHRPFFEKPSDATAKAPAWLNDPTMYHNRGETTFGGENAEYGDFTGGLDDLWTERPEVLHGLTDIYAGWIRRFGVDGYRLDTLKATDLAFWRPFAEGVGKAADKAGKRDFFLFGEAWSKDQEVTSTFVRRGGLPATLDFPFQGAAQSYVTGKAPASSLAGLYAKDDLYTAAGTDAGRLPTFLGNHDMGRIATLIKAGSDPNGLRRLELANELMFLTRGQPVVYSGDEQGFTGALGDKGSRQDMFASRTPDYLDDRLIGTDKTHASDNHDTGHPLYRTIAELGALRKAHPALRDGEQITRYAADRAGVFAASRIDRDQRAEYVIAVNNATTAQTVTFDTYTPGSGFQPLYGTGETAATGADGRLTITVPALSAVAYRAEKPIPAADGAPAVTITAPAAGTLVPGRTELTAAVTGDPLSTVTFSARAGNGPWQPIGTAGRAPYRVFHDLTGLAGGAEVQYRAVARDGRGRTATTTSRIRVGTVRAEAGYAVVHYQRPAGDYDGWRLHATGDVDAAALDPQGEPFTGTDAYGRFAWVKLRPGATKVTFTVSDANGVKDVDADRSLNPQQTPGIWLHQGDPAISYQGPAPAPAPNTAILHYRRPAGDYTGWGLHLWDGAATPTADWGAPLLPESFDSFGAVFRIPLAAGATGLSYIMHAGEAKDLPTDQRLEFADAGREVWVQAGVQERLLPSVVKPAKLDLTRADAVRVDRDTIAWQTGTPDTLEPAGAATDGRVYDLVHAPNGGLRLVDGDLAGDYRSIRLTAQRDGLTEKQRRQAPELWQYPAFQAAAALPSGDGQFYVTERDAQGRLMSVTGVR